MAAARDRCRRTKVPWRAIAAMLSVVALTGVGPLGMEVFAQPAMPPGISGNECEQLAKLPNPPISVETCRAMMGMAAGMDAAAADSRAHRPGDSALTCAQIFAELQTMAGVGISELAVEKSDAAVKAGSALADQQAGVLAGFWAETLAMGLVVGAVSPVMPNFVGAAIAAAWQARFVALGVAAQAAQAPVNKLMADALQGGATELVDAMQADPRFGRLMQLAMAKECEAPAGAKP